MQQLAQIKKVLITCLLWLQIDRHSKNRHCVLSSGTFFILVYFFIYSEVMITSEKLFFHTPIDTLKYSIDYVHGRFFFLLFHFPQPNTA